MPTPRNQRPAASARTLGCLLAVLVAGATLLPSARAQSATALLDALARQAATAAPDFTGFSAARGGAMFNLRHATLSCASCHTSDPRGPGRHASTQRAITPLAPAANPQRFTDPAKVEKWFRRNCNDVLGRACTPQEQGDIVAWLVTLK